MRKKKDPDPYQVPLTNRSRHLTNGSGSGRPEKTCGSGSPTLFFGLDHGLYESMPFDMRGALCGLWVAVVENNHKEQYSAVQQFSAVCESYFQSQRHFEAQRLVLKNRNYFLRFWFRFRLMTSYGSGSASYF